VSTEAEKITERQESRREPEHVPGMQWPDPRSRRIFESQMLRYHAERLEARYPATIWPDTGGVAGDARMAAAAQQAFVAGIRFAASQLHDEANELNDQVYALEEAAQQAGAQP
jgi:hypothetical protein